MDKSGYRVAYYDFLKVKKFYNSYADLDTHLAASKELATVHVLLQVDDAYGLLPYGLEVDLSHIHSTHKWVRFHPRWYKEADPDFVASMHIDALDIGPEKESYESKESTKEIEKWVNKIDDTGQVVTDSTGQVIQIKEIEKLYAHVHKIERSKWSKIEGRLLLLETDRGIHIDQEPLSHVGFQHAMAYYEDFLDKIGGRIETIPSYVGL